MTSEDAREIDRRCVLKWLYDLYTSPRAALERYSDDLEALEILSYDAFVLLLTPQEKQQLRHERNAQRFFADADGTIAPIPVVVRCRDCKWWDNVENSPYGYCIACQHGYRTKRWEIGIHRKCKSDWFCADGEQKTNENKT